MKQIFKISVVAVMNLVAQTALAKTCALHQSEVGFPVTQNTALGQYFLLGVMLTLIAMIFVLKWVYRKPSDPLDQNLIADNPALQTLKQLRIGERFSDWSRFQRLAGQKQPTP